MTVTNSDNHNGGNSGITFCGLLAIAFIVLKLIGVIHWSWVWVLAPLWIPIVLIVIIALIILMIAAWGGEH